jgi:hypothetical protein
METSIDLSVSPTEPAKANKGTEAPLPATRPSFKEVLDSSKGQLYQDVTMDGSTGAEDPPTHRKQITLSSLRNKKDDAVNKRTRSSAAHSNDQDQPSSKRPPSAVSLAVQTAQNMIDQVRDLPSGEAKTATVQKAANHVIAWSSKRNQGKEQAIQEEVRRSAQNIRWTKGPLPSNIDHRFYDLRQSGTEPLASLVVASRNMVLKWKRALGRSYFPLSEHAGGSVMRLEHTHRTFKALTLDMPISGWISSQGMCETLDHA